MEANRAAPRVAWLTLLGAVISVVCLSVLYALGGVFASLLGLLMDHPGFRAAIKTASHFAPVASSMVLLWSAIWIRYYHRKQGALKR
jgi:hypothetical protein